VRATNPGAEARQLIGAFANGVLESPALFYKVAGQHHDYVFRDRWMCGCNGSRTRRPNRQIA
jgi:hypothetical protein